MTEPVHQLASEHYSVCVAVVDWTSDRSAADEQLRKIVGTEVEVVHLRGPFGSSSTRSAAIWTGNVREHLWADVVRNLVAACESSAVRRVAVHGGVDVAASEIAIGIDRGLIIERAVQLLDVAQSGQFVTSDTGAAQLAADPPTELELIDLGWHRLRDLGPPVRMWQVSTRSSMRMLAPVRSLDAFRHNLPIMHTSLVGREDEARMVERLLTEASCVTLTGSGGIGKSRLAGCVAARTIDKFSGGVWWVELVSVSDHDTVDGAIRGVLEGDVADAPTLVVLDNCEHVANSCARVVADIIETYPSTRILSTSREPLGVAGEAVWRVLSLATPADRGDLDVEQLRSFPSVRLFADRARTHDRTFVLDESNATSIVQICARLDGIPLAIELAAARCRQLGPARVAAELDDRFALLTHAPRTEHTRHQTLSASVDWSHDRLGSEERLVFRRLAAFPGPFTLDLATEVVAAFGDVTRGRAVDLISRLVDCSLVDTIDRGQGPHRYRLLETLRLYATGRAIEADELHRLRDAHMDWWLSWFDRASRAADVDDIVTVESMTENLRAALEWSSREPLKGLTLLAHAARAWHGSGRGVDAVLAADRVLTDDNAITEPDAWLDAAVVMSVHYAFVRGGAGTHELAHRTAEVADRLGDPFALAAAHWIERTDVQRSARLRDLARNRGDAYLEALTALTAAEHLAEREPLVALSVLDDESVIATSGSEYLASWCELVRGRIARDVGDFATCLRIGHRLASDRSTHMVFNGMILLVQAGLLTSSRDALTAAINASTTPIATARMIAEGEVARTHLAYLDARSPSRVDPEFGIEPMTPGSLLLCALEAIDAGHTELTARALAAAGPDGPLLDAVRAAINASSGEVERWYDALSLAGQHGLEPLVVISLEGVAMQRASLGNWVDCLRLISAARQRRAELDYRWQFPLWREAVDTARSRSTEQLPASDVDKAMAEGAGMTASAATAYALRGHGRRGRPRLGWASLTPTELQVAESVAKGLTNREVGDLMVVSPTTVKSHLDHIFTKLGVHSRAEVAASYARRTPPT